MTGSAAELELGPAPGARRLFLAAVVLLDLVLLLLLDRLPWVAGGLLAGALVLGCVARSEWLLAFLLVGAPLLSPLGLRPGAQTALLIGLRGLLLLGWGVALRRGPARPIGAAHALGRLLSDPLVLLVLALTALLFLGQGRSPAPEYAAAKAHGFLVSNLVLFLAPALLWPLWRGERNLDRFLDAGLVMGGLFAAWGALVALGALPPPESTRLTWLGLSPIWAARGVATWLGLLGWAIARRRLAPGWALLCVPPGLLLILATGSRGPLLALLLAPLALLLLPPGGSPQGARDRRRWGGLLGVLFLLLAILVAVAASGGLEALVRSPLGLEGGAQGGAGWARAIFGRDPSVAYRLEVLRRSLDALREVWLWGAGTGSYPALLFLRDVRLYPHNLEAELLIELGLPGLLLLLGLLGIAWRRARRLVRRRRSDAWPFLLLAMAWLNAQVSGDLPANAELWFWLGMVTGLWLAYRADRGARVLPADAPGATGHAPGVMVGARG